jgi:flagellar motor switch protein FliN/FliY
MRIAVANNGPDDTPAPAGAEASLIDSVEVTLEAYLGKSRITISDLKALKPDATITLDASLGSTVELRLNDRTVARGDLVAVGDKFGVRLTEIGR